MKCLACKKVERKAGSVYCSAICCEEAKAIRDKLGGFLMDHGIITIQGVVELLSRRST